MVPKIQLPAKQTRTSRSTDVQNERASKLERGHWAVAQLQESRDTLLRQQVQDESDRHVVTLDEKDDQRIFQDDSSLQRMHRLILGERRGPGSIACWDTRNIKNTGAVGWQDRDDELSRCSPPGDRGRRRPFQDGNCSSANESSSEEPMLKPGTGSLPQRGPST